AADMTPSRTRRQNERNAPRRRGERDEMQRGGPGGTAGRGPQGPALGYYGPLRTLWSMAPKRFRPPASNISMRTRSPNFMKGVDGFPWRIVSTVRCSAIHE